METSFFILSLIQVINFWYDNFLISDLALQQTFRVLKKGGMVGFSVWGRPENSPKFTISDTAKKILQLPFSPNPSFHLADNEVLRQRVLNAGFSRVLAYYIVITNCKYDD
jgi:ubiquinone/menaquinone biosynthesis C-methylase UbiE